MSSQEVQTMKAQINITMDNAAFEDAPERELARILRELANKVERNGLGRGGRDPIRDVNGNTVGKFIVFGK